MYLITVVFHFFLILQTEVKKSSTICECCLFMKINVLEYLYIYAFFSWFIHEMLMGQKQIPQSDANF